MRSSTTVARRSWASPRKIKRPSTVIDHYQTMEKMRDGTMERPTREGQAILAQKLMDTLDGVLTSEAAFQERDPPKRVTSDDDARTLYHDFCESFCDKAEANKQTFQRLTANSKSARSLLRTMREDLEELERRSYRIEMNLPE